MLEAIATTQQVKCEEINEKESQNICQENTSASHNSIDILTEKIIELASSNNNNASDGKGNKDLIDESDEMESDNIISESEESIYESEKSDEEDD